MVEGRSSHRFHPNPGPQTDAYECPADELYYGGAAGSGKTRLLIGLAATRHRLSIIFRREYPQLREVIAQSKEALSDVGRFNQNELLWQLSDGRTIELGAVQHKDDWRKYQGRPHDLVCFDELPDFLESQYDALVSWLRGPEGQRKRVVGAGNPPTTAEGMWVIKRWAPWLSEQHGRPAASGELRYFARVGERNADVEVDDASPIPWHGELVIPRSRTFIRGRLSDTPQLGSDYLQRLLAQPEPLRSRLLYGDFRIGRDDPSNQVIPTDWVRAAQRRWQERGPREFGPISAIGVDVSRGGIDQAVIATRHAEWYAPLDCIPGEQTTEASRITRVILALLSAEQKGSRPLLVVDADGNGAGVIELLWQHRDAESRPLNVYGFRAAGTAAVLGTKVTDRSGYMTFSTWRSYMWWHMRELLDPERDIPIQLPDDPALLADLTAPRWEPKTNGIQIETKVEIRKRLGRSTDRGDAVCMASVDVTPEGPAQIPVSTTTQQRSQEQMVDGRHPRGLVEQMRVSAMQGVKAEWPNRFSQ